jgi:DNA helicase-2/ATP-dependent DNA helicase PcrA
MQQRTKDSGSRTVLSDGLNPAQRAAVDTLTGPLLVLAGAGVGKTRVVTYRIANLIRHGTPAERILAVTFTRKAAGEMHERAMALLAGRGRRGKRAANRPQISTFHALCVRILRRHITHLGYPERFVICDRGEQESVARAALREIRVSDDSLRPGDLLAMIGQWKNRSTAPRQAASLAESDREHLAAAAYRRYQTHLKARGMVDFDDLLLCAEQLLATRPAVLREEAGRFDQILVDEYQDTNGSQYRLVKSLAAGHRNLCVVGDDDQSIYGWRGAEVRHILRFAHDWPDAKVIRLEINYRSAAAILGYANALIAFNRHRHEKVLRASRGEGERPRILQLQDETQEAQVVVADIVEQLKRNAGARAGDFAILCRTNEQPRSFETELRRAQLPYVLLGGMSFFDRKEIRDLLAYLKLIANPADEASLLRIINTPPRGIGPGAVKQLLGAAVAQGKPLWEILPTEASCGVNPCGPAAPAITKFVTLIEELREHAKCSKLDELVEVVLIRTGYRSELERLYPDPAEREARLASVEELVNAAANYTSAAGEPASAGGLSALQQFLDDALLDGREESSDKEEQLARNAVALLTLHAAKGLEYPHVYMVGMEEGILPHKRVLAADDDAQIDEERRLCYVGVTRAQERLTLTLALSRRKWGKPRETIPSRFLYEMTGQAEKAPTAKPTPSRPVRSRQRSS